MRIENEIRNEEYKQALSLIENGKEIRICYALDRPTGSSQIGCPIIKTFLWPELSLFFESDEWPGFPRNCNLELINSKELKFIREIILDFCIEMTNPK